MWTSINELLTRWFGPESALRGPVIAVLTILAAWIAYRLSRRALVRFLKRRAHKADNIRNFLFFYRYIWMAAVLILAVISLSGSLTALGISAAFLGMILGWSLQAPVTGIAAWLMVILKRPFKIGDRVIVAGIVGDVVDISLTHIVLDQVGGTVSGEEKSGRGVMVPNAILFQQIIYNYAFETKFLLDEVSVLITYESDVDTADKICLQAARDVVGEIIAETRQEPFTRLELADSGIRVRLRYQTISTERQRVSSDIVRRIISGFNETPSVEFAYPHTEVLHRPKPPAA